MKLLTALSGAAIAGASLLQSSAAIELLKRNTTGANATHGANTILQETICGGTGWAIDLPGSDIGSQQESDWRYCWRRADAVPNCWAWTWTDYNGGTCWFKSGFGQAVYRAGAMSGIIYRPDPGANCVPRYMMLHNCDMPGSDLGSSRANDYNGCIDAALPGGLFFTWSDYNGGTCWLKRNVSPCQYAPNKHTGIYMF